jgi:hypothetical protein
MNYYDIDSETISYRIHDAERMRAQVLNELLFAWGGNVKRWISSLGKFARSLSKRGHWNLSLPAPHH